MANSDIYKNMGKSVFSDECYTTNAESDKIVKYLIEKGVLKKEMKIWLPFDNELSNLYKSLKKMWGGYIILSNLEIGLDFYNYTPNEFDLIFSNPPFKNRTNLFKRLHQINKPFIILQATQMFNNQFTVNFLCEFSDLYQMILPRSRMSFLRYKEKEKKISNDRHGAAFYSFWLCYKIGLEKTFNKLEDSGKERIIEKYDEYGNVIEDNHLTLFNFHKKD
jgi:16S rRNA G966 N2-methylase RsmD